jgi:hypothetical protein
MNFRDIRRDIPRYRIHVLYTGERTIAAGDRLWAVPLEGLWRPSRANTDLVS